MEAAVSTAVGPLRPLAQTHPHHRAIALAGLAEAQAKGAADAATAVSTARESVALYRQIQPRLFAYIDDTLREGYEQIITALDRSDHQRESAALRKEVPPRQR
jgi:hypothetical protein